MEKISKNFKFTNEPINIIIKLSNNFYDIGFYSDSEYEDGTNNPTLVSTKVEGFGISRLSELKKYNQGTTLQTKYKIYSETSDGIILEESNNNVITYIIDGIKYFDDINNNITTFEYLTPTKFNDIEDQKLVKRDEYLNYSDYNKKVDLDIVRQSLNIFENHMRLSDIRNVEELTLYGGGFFNIIKNS
jgi:hypothetical protein